MKIFSKFTKFFQFAISADQKLCELTTSVSQMNMMAEDLRALRSTTTKLEKECAEIRGKFDETSVRISESLSKLQLKVEEQVMANYDVINFQITSSNRNLDS